MKIYIITLENQFSTSDVYSTCQKFEFYVPKLLTFNQTLLKLFECAIVVLSLTCYIISKASLCSYVRMYVCQTITFESLDVQSSYLHIQGIFEKCGLSSCTNVTVTWAEKCPLLSCHPYVSVSAWIQLAQTTDLHISRCCTSCLCSMESCGHW